MGVNASLTIAITKGDRLYTLIGAPVWVAVTAAAAFLVGLSARLLTPAGRGSLWAMAFFGLGSPALAASRGDTPQPLLALCWAAAVYACLRYRQGGGRRWVWISATAVVYGVLARPLEGSILLLAVVIMVGLRRPIPIWALLGLGAAWSASLALTLLLNWARFGAPLNFGYKLGTPEASWTTPIWIGFPSALLSPGRGVLWEFPALILAAVGVRLLWSQGRRAEAAALALTPAALFLEACTFTDWVGGWDWGFRFFQPALPLVATLAAVGVTQLPIRLRAWLPGALLLAGFLWNIPAISTDILGGYGATYQDGVANWRLDAFPLIGAWRFLHHVFPEHGADAGTIDIVWFRAVLVVGKAALVPFVVLLASAIGLWVAALRTGARVAIASGETPRARPRLS